MLLNNKAITVALTLLALGGCGGRAYDDAPRVDAPPLGDAQYQTPPAQDQQPSPTYSGAGTSYDRRGHDRYDPAPPPPAQASPADLPQGDGPRGTSGEGQVRYDEVGYAGAGAGSPGISAAARSLPRSAYAEVTSLDTGKTILVLIADQDAPGNVLIDLSPGAAQLLGVGEGSAVRVRRVNPPGPDQAALAHGQAAGSRIDTPPTLLTALRHKLGAAPRQSAPIRSAPPVARRGAGTSYGQPGAAPHRAAPPAATSGYFVQVAALSSRDRAEELARSLGGSIQQAGGIWRVRVGPFADAASAQRARDGVAKRGYGDARIVHDE